MKLDKLFLLICFTFFSATLCFSEDTEPSETSASLRRERERTLAFGLNTEVSGLIREFITDRDLSYNDHLLSLFETTTSDQIRRDIIELYTVANSINLKNQVIEAIKNRDYEPRSVIVASIRYIAEINAVEEYYEIFLELLDDRQREIRLESVKALTATGNRKFSKPLMQMYDIEDETSVRLQILLDLGKLEDPDTAEFLKEIAFDRDQERIYRQYAIHSLGYLRDEEIFNDLVAAFKEDDPFIRTHALAAVAKYDKKEANTIIFEGMRDENWRIRRQAVVAAGERKSEEFVQILIFRSERDPVEDVRVASLTALAEIGGEEAFDFIRRVAEEQRGSVRLRLHAFTLAINNDTGNSLVMIETLLQRESAAANQRFFESLASELCKVEYPGLAPFFERMLDSSSVVARIAGLRGIRLNKISRLKDRVQAMAEDQRQASAVRTNALATLEVLQGI
ncbi:MAG: HEAT repeat domain-containing protein [Spirochaetaceae bacterium]|nr:HEAT repeat domain-containing protein [Spirochaetaceae bacterium]